jgi:hypothetical protein
MEKDLASDGRRSITGRDSVSLSPRSLDYLWNYTQLPDQWGPETFLGVKALGA